MSILPNDFNIAYDSSEMFCQETDCNKHHSEKYTKLNCVKKKLKAVNRKFICDSTKNINDLSPEVFQIIVASFMKLSNWSKLIPLRLVCKHWRSNIDSYLSSKHYFNYVGRLTKGIPPPGMNYYEINAMTSFYPNLKQLTVKNFTVSDHLIVILRQNCPKIDNLSIFGCRGLTWKGINILTLRFSALTYIDISHCELDEYRFSILIEGLTKLKIINAINPGREVTGKCLNNVGHEIEDIWIGLNHISDPNSALEALVSGNGKNLIHFGLIVSNFQKTNFNLITDNMKKLKSLKLTFGSYGYGTLINIGKLIDLELLVLAENSRNNDDSVLNEISLKAIIKGCIKLKSLSIAGTKSNTCRYTHNSISQIPVYCQKMEQIRFLNGNNVLDQTLIDLANLKFIRVLHLNSMTRVSDNGIINFVKKAKKTIRNFIVNDCQNVTEAIIEPWIDLAKQRSSETIKLSLVGVIVKRSLDALPSNLIITVKQK